MFNHARQGLFPAYCGNCREVVLGDLGTNYINCEKCGAELIFYSDPSLYSAFDAAKHPDYNDFDIDARLQVHRLCPKCNEMSLLFNEIGMWD